MLAVAFLLIDVLQLLSFGFDVDTPPSLTSLAKELAALQTFGLDAFSPTAVLAAAVAVVPLFSEPKFSTCARVSSCVFVWLCFC